MLNRYVRLLRPEQWLKSIFVLLGIIYSHKWDKISSAFIAFIVFSIASSAVYIFNDIYDRHADALHPEKSRRPIASGHIPIKNAYFILVGLIIISVLLSMLVSYQLTVIIFCYWFINYGYNLGLKQWPIIDVLCIASGFVLRMLAGTIGIGLPYSRWLLVSVTFLSLLIALTKRYLEKQRSLLESVRPVLKYYSDSTLKILIILNALFALVSYLVYIIAVHNHNMFYLLTTLFAFAGIARFIHVIFASDSQQDDPILVMVRDNKILMLLIGFAICTLMAFLGT